jgi:NADPH2:quinone reductase
VPLQRYVATVTLKPVTDGDRTFWHWESSFETPPGRERELRDMVAQGCVRGRLRQPAQALQQPAHLRPAGPRRRGPARPGHAREVAVERYGGPEELRPQEAEAPAPRAGEVRIRQRAIGVNFIDVYLRRGWMPSMLALPGVPGMEAAGSVLDAGPQVSGLLPGDRVAYLGPVPGAYCDLRCVPADWVVRLPAAVEDDVRRRAAAQGHHCRLPAARPRAGASRHPAAGARGSRRRRAADLCAGRAGCDATVLGHGIQREPRRASRANTAANT